MVNNKNLFRESVVFGNFVNADDIKVGGNQANAKFKRNVLIGNDLTLGLENSTTTNGVTTYTNTGGNILVKKNGITYTLTPTILSYLSTINDNIQDQIDNITTPDLSSYAPKDSPTFSGNITINENITQTLGTSQLYNLVVTNDVNLNGSSINLGGSNLFPLSTITLNGRIINIAPNATNSTEINIGNLNALLNLKVYAYMELNGGIQQFPNPTRTYTNSFLDTSVKSLTISNGNITQTLGSNIGINTLRATTINGDITQTYTSADMGYGLTSFKTTLLETSVKSLTLGLETSTTTNGVTTYTNTGGNILVKINGITYTLTPTILSHLSTISSNIQDQIDYITTTELSSYALKDSPTFTGTPLAPTPSTTDDSTKIATTEWVNNQGYLTTSPDLTIYAPKDSPTFTGTPLAPTPSTTDDSTKIATTAFVKAQGYLTTSPDLSSYAPKDSPTFTGTPLAPTPSTTDDSTKIATTEWVNNQGYLTTTPDLTIYAPKNNPTFTGTAIAPTPDTTDDSTKIATSAFVKAQGFLKTADFSSYAPINNPTFTGRFIANSNTYYLTF